MLNFLIGVNVDFQRLQRPENKWILSLAEIYIAKYMDSTLYCDNYHDDYYTYTIRNDAFARFTFVFIRKHTNRQNLNTLSVIYIL